MMRAMPPWLENEDPAEKGSGNYLKQKLAEGVGFEPTNPAGLTVFKTAAIVRSAIPPGEMLVSQTSLLYTPA